MKKIWNDVELSERTYYRHLKIAYTFDAKY